MFCPQCGQNIPDQSKYCFACGAFVSAAASFLSGASVPGSTSHTSRPATLESSGSESARLPGPARYASSISSKPRRNIRLVIVAAVLTVIGGGVTYDVLAAKARAHAEAERQRAAEERRKEEARRRKDEQERLWNMAEQKIRGDAVIHRHANCDDKRPDFSSGDQADRPDMGSAVPW
ncbi:MAG: zinc ribbon domain-containing protein [Bryobacterales bacterium]|nr:zinc ribbon domain-containing protein [Bryobacterales bacterium]